MNYTVLEEESHKEIKNAFKNLQFKIIFLIPEGAPFVWAEYTLLLQLSLGCCWQVNERDLPRPVSCEDWLWPLTTNLCPLWRRSYAGVEWWCFKVVCSLSWVCWSWDFQGGRGQGQPPLVFCPQGPPCLSYKAVWDACCLYWAWRFPDEAKLWN